MWVRTNSVKDEIRQSIDTIENLITHHLNANSVSETIKRASTYSIEAGGKRFRPLLLLSTLEALNYPLHEGHSAGAAIEMIHTYSLIHDDLPAMDNDDLRRGQPTNHKIFGEATAILAGDNLLTESANVVLNDVSLPSHKKIEVLTILLQNAGQQGMISGQMLDIEAETTPVTLDELTQIHNYKTGALIRSCVEMACVIGEASDEVTAGLKQYSTDVGVLFQIRDDILDVVSNVEELGKNTGSDEMNNKTTYVSEYGLDGAYKQFEILYADIESGLDQLKHKIDIKPLSHILEKLKLN